LPPEYLREEPIDRRLDVYAMGITLWIALAGVEPWPETKDSELVKKILSQGVPRLSMSGLVVAESLEAVLRCACARTRDDRFPTALAMASELERLARETGWMASHTEVAEFVEQLEGERLTSLRESVASRISLSGGGTLRPPVGSSSAPPVSTEEPIADGAADRGSKASPIYARGEVLPPTQVAIDSMLVRSTRTRTRSGTTPKAEPKPPELGPRQTKLGVGKLGDAPASAPADEKSSPRGWFGPSETKLGLGTTEEIASKSAVTAPEPSQPRRFGPHETKLGLGTAPTTHDEKLDSGPPLVGPPVRAEPELKPNLSLSESPRAAADRWKLVAIVALIVVALLVGVVIGVLSR